MLDDSNNNAQDIFDIDDNLNCIFLPTRRPRFMSCDITSLNSTQANMLNEMAISNSDSHHQFDQPEFVGINPFKPESDVTN